jgi:hypothetical protein
MEEIRKSHKHLMWNLDYPHRVFSSGTNNHQLTHNIGTVCIVCTVFNTNCFNTVHSLVIIVTE